MLRMLLWLAWFSILILGLLELLSLGTMGDFGEIAKVSALVTFALTLVVFLAFLAGGQPRLSGFLLRAPMKRVRRTVVRKAPAASRSDAGIAIDALIQRIASASRAPETSSGAVLADGLRSLDLAAFKWPWDLPSVGFWLEDSIQALEDNLLLRVLLPERARAMVALLRELSDSFVGYSHHVPVTRGELARARFNDANQSGLFADFATGLTGAVVLADASQTRTGIAGGVSLWHSSRYEPLDSGDSGATYADLHSYTGGSAGSCGWGAKLKLQDKTRVGDFDGRVLNVLGVALTQDNRSGSVEFLLKTNESCYAATDLSPTACKGELSGPMSDPSLDAKWHRQPDLIVAEREQREARRLNMLTVIAAVILESEAANGSRKSLLLSRRASTIRHGNSVLSMLGGVMNLPGGKAGGDVDLLGYPDPRRAIKRELEEEIGVSIPWEKLHPTVVYVFNQRDPSPEGQSPGKGQLLTTVSFTTHLEMTLDEVRQARVVSASAVGRYEVDELLEIELPAIDSASKPDLARLDAARQFAKSLLALAPQIDQTAMMSCLYACAETYSIRATFEAFTDVWANAWHDIPWSTSLEETHREQDGRSARRVGSQIDSPWLLDISSHFGAAPLAETAAAVS